MGTISIKRLRRILGKSNGGSLHRTKSKHDNPANSLGDPMENKRGPQCVNRTPEITTRATKHLNRGPYKTRRGPKHHHRTPRGSLYTNGRGPSVLHAVCSPLLRAR